MAKVTDYTFAAVADDSPNFPLTRPPLDGSGVVRLKSSALRTKGGVRPSKCVPPIGGRAGVRTDFKTCKARYDSLSPAELAQWTAWATEDDMDVFQFFMRTCQVYERRSMGWPPAAMAAWKGWVCKIACTQLDGEALEYFGIYNRSTGEDGAATCQVAVKCATDDSKADSTVRVEVFGVYDDGGGSEQYLWTTPLGAGDIDWQLVEHVTPAHNWLPLHPRINVKIIRDTGAIWLDEFKIIVGGVRQSDNPHFNLGWSKYGMYNTVPEGYNYMHANAWGGFDLMYLEDVP